MPVALPVEVLPVDALPEEVLEEPFRAPALTSVPVDLPPRKKRGVLEEDQIAGLEIALGNGCAFGVHGNLRTTDIDAVATQHIVNEAGAVETAGISAAPLVRNA